MARRIVVRTVEALNREVQNLLRLRGSLTLDSSVSERLRKESFAAIDGTVNVLKKLIKAKSETESASVGDG